MANLDPFQLSPEAKRALEKDLQDHGLLNSRPRPVFRKGRSKEVLVLSGAMLLAVLLGWFVEKAYSNGVAASIEASTQGDW
jgi:hypothetical protein